MSVSNTRVLSHIIVIRRILDLQPAATVLECSVEERFWSELFSKSGQQDYAYVYHDLMSNLVNSDMGDTGKLFCNAVSRAVELVPLLGSDK